MEVKKSKYFVMERNNNAVAGANCIAVKTCKSDAERMCKGRNDRWVLSQQEHDAWHEKNVTQYYR